MPRKIELRLAIGVVGPLMDLLHEIVERKGLAQTFDLSAIDADMHEHWREELTTGQTDDLQKFRSVFGAEFMRSGATEFLETDSDALIRACSVLRLRLRTESLKSLADEALEVGEIDLAELGEKEQRAFLAYVFLASLQERLIQHLGAAAPQEAEEDDDEEDDEGDMSDDADWGDEDDDFDDPESEKN